MTDERLDDEELDTLVHGVDLDGLVRLIDARCASRDWAGLLRVRDQQLDRIQRGRDESAQSHVSVLPMQTTAFSPAAL